MTVMMYVTSLTAEVQVNGLYICVCVEYLMTIADFFVKGMPQAPEQPAVTATAQAPAGNVSVLRYSIRIVHLTLDE